MIKLSDNHNSKSMPVWRCKHYKTRTKIFMIIRPVLINVTELVFENSMYNRKSSTVRNNKLEKVFKLYALVGILCS